MSGVHIDVTFDPLGNFYPSFRLASSDDFAVSLLALWIAARQARGETEIGEAPQCLDAMRQARYLHRTPHLDLLDHIPTEMLEAALMRRLKVASAENTQQGDQR